MAIAYLDGGRITGLSTDTKPTNVDAGSMFIETDSGGKYVYNGSGWLQESFDSINEALGKGRGILQRAHFVEWFTGKSLNTNRWHTWDESGTAVFAMGDETDGGFKITTSAGGRSGIDFNNKRNYHRLGGVLIGVVRLTSTSNTRMFCGFRNDGTSNGATQQAWFHSYSGSNVGLSTGDASAGGFTVTDVARSTNFVVAKTELTRGFSNLTSGMPNQACQLSINGTLKVTRSENMPTVTLQPELIARDDGSSGCTVHCTYMEAYNR